VTPTFIDNVTYGDVQDNLTSVTDPIVGLTTCASNKLDRQRRQTGPDTGTTVMDYDPAGNSPLDLRCGQQRSSVLSPDLAHLQCRHLDADGFHHRIQSSGRAASAAACSTCLGQVTFIRSVATGNGAAMATQAGGTLALEDCEATAVTVDRCLLTANLGYGESGGAIATNGKLVVRNATLSGNNLAERYYGGGINNEGNTPEAPSPPRGAISTAVG